MKMSLIGGGGVRTPYFVESLAKYAETLGVTRLTLMDNDEEKLTTYGALAQWMAEQTGALGIVGGLFHQMLLEHLFHFVKAAKAEGVGKTNQRGRGNIRLLRNGGHGIESHAIAVIKDIAGDLFQAFA